MARGEDDAWVQLATKIPKALHRELKLHCVTQDKSVMRLVTEAIRERLASPGALTEGALKPARRTRQRPSHLAAESSNRLPVGSQESYR
jgi:hypothetical protein